ncbi:MAG: cellulase family glycosylhydrolase [Leeuwenhoekiella sp.]
MKLKFLASLLFLLSITCFAQGFLKTDGVKIVNENNKNVLLRGIGLGGYMVQEGYMLKVPFSGQQYVIKDHIEELLGKEKTQEFYTAWLQNTVQKADVDSLKSWGFNSIRLPMHYNLYTLPVEKEPVKGENTWLETGFTMTDSLVNWCRANNMYLILDMHATPGGQGHDVNISDRDPSKPSLWESAENQQKLVDLWVKLAEKYKDEPVIGAYDIINEPNWSFEEGKNKNGTQDSENKPLRELMVRITKAIREIDKKHIIIIEGNGWGNNYNGVLPPWDDNMVLSFHKYWNYNDTASIQNFLDFRKKYQIPIWLGESGENSNVWFADAIKLMETNNIGWCWWPLKKLGSNNPLEVKVNPGYQKVLDYWNSKAEKPTSTDAYKAFMQLAENTKIENCIVHRDVIDAMIRQPHADKTIPYKEIVVKDSASIKAADYDLGKNRIAYKDSVVGNYYISKGGDRESWNNGHAYRNDGVDIYKNENTQDAEAVYVGDLEKGEFLQYTFKVVQSGNYKFSIKVRGNNAKGKASVEINTKHVQDLNIPNSSEDWEWISTDLIPLKIGTNTLKIDIKSGDFDLETIKILK